MTKDGTLLMVVDDDDDIRELMKILLEADGYRVITATDGLDAWQQIKTKEPPSLILLDLMMPRMDGDQFLKKLRASSSAAIPVIIMSGHTMAMETARTLKGNGCLMKPVEFDELMNIVHRFAPNHPVAVPRRN